MKRFYLTILFVFILGITWNGLVKAETLKIGFVNLQKVMDESETGKKARKSFETFVKSKQQKVDEDALEVDKMKAVIKQMKVDLKKKSEVGPPIFSDDAKRKMIEEIRDHEEDLQKLIRDLRRSNSDAQEEIKKREAELTEEILKEIRSIVVVVGKKENFSAVFQKNDPFGLVLYSGEAVDITDMIIQKYNESKN